jgi:hypothetical protein
MTYNDDAPGDSTPLSQESNMHTGMKVALISDSESLGMLKSRAPVRGVWVVRWYAGKEAGKELLVHENALRGV